MMTKRTGWWVLVLGALAAACGSSSDETPAPETGDEQELQPARPLFAEPQGQAARLPIVLAHGFMGSPTNFWAFYRVAEQLRADGHAVFEGEVPPFDSADVRAGLLAEQVQRVLDQTGAPKVHLIAHSMGGLDSRVLISSLGFGDRVASLTTISTPHRGSRIADAFLRLVPDQADDAIDTVARLIGKTFNETADRTDVRASLSSIAESSADAFNDAHPDDERVYYQSWAGVSNVACLPNPIPGLESDACQGQLLRHTLRTDCMDPLLAPVAGLVAHGTELRPNDGMVTVESAIWGNFRGCIPADHLDEVGQIKDSAMNTRTGFDHLRFYRTIAFDLASREDCFEASDRPSLDCAR